MTDVIRQSFLHTQFVEGMALAQQSDILSLAPVGGSPPSRYIAKLECDGLSQMPGEIAVCDRHLVGINFPEKYLRTPCNPGEVLTWLEPDTEFHPNILPPYCCVGHIAPGMGLVSLLHQIYQMVSWQRFTPLEHDALNKSACSWARDNLDRFPVDPRRSLVARRSHDVQPDRQDDHE